MVKPRKSKPVSKRGRKKIPAVPGQAVSSPVQPISTTDALSAQLTAIRAKASAGARLANHESRILRDAWLLDMATHLWPNLESCAADLGVSPSTVRGYADAGCPGLEPHSPIPKAPVLAWLLKRAHERGGATHANKESIEDVDLRIKSAKAAKMESALIAEAEDLATQGVIERMAQLRHHLLHVVPGALVECIHANPDRQAAEDAFSRLIDQALATASHHSTTSAPTDHSQE